MRKERWKDSRTRSAVVDAGLPTGGMAITLGGVKGAGVESIQMTSFCQRGKQGGFNTSLLHKVVGSSPAPGEQMSAIAMS